MFGCQAGTSVYSSVLTGGCCMMLWLLVQPPALCLVKCMGNPWVLLDVPGPVPAKQVQVFAWVHMGGPWAGPDPYPQLQ